MNDNYLIIIPTYNESDNITNLIINLQYIEGTHLLFIDDSSPDGTGEILDNLKQKYKNIDVIHRNGKLGIGSAHKDALKWARRNGWINVITMDADMTHSPSDVRKLIELKNKSSIIVCSRWLSKNSLPNWSIYRKLMTKLGHLLTYYIRCCVL